MPLVRAYRFFCVVALVVLATAGASSIVMSLGGNPDLDEPTRLQALQELPISGDMYLPDDAVHVAMLRHPSAMRLETGPHGPTYRVAWGDERFGAINAISGQNLTGIAQHDARLAAQAFAGEGAGAIESVQVVTSDRWTSAARFDPHRPLYRVAFDGSPRYVLHVSSRTGEVVQQTTRATRVTGWIRTALHEFAPAFSSERRAWGGWISLAVALAGAALGLAWLLAAAASFAGWKAADALSPFGSTDVRLRWLQCVAGAVAFVWCASAVPSLLTSRDQSPDSRDMLAWQERGLALERFTRPPGEAIWRASASGSPRQLSLAQVAGSPVYVVRFADGGSRLFDASDRTAGVDSLPLRAIDAAAEALRPHAKRESVLLEQHDAYYTAPRPLPVVRVVFEAEHREIFYIDPRSATPVAYFDAGARFRHRMLHGVHRLGFLAPRDGPWRKTLVSVFGAVTAGIFLAAAWIALSAQTRARIRKTTT